MVGLKEEMSFTPIIKEKFGEEIIIVKEAKGTQPISQWYKNWVSPSGQSSNSKPEIYNKLLSKVFDAYEKYKFKTITFVWMQGERDARLEYGTVYEESLIGLLKQLQNDLLRFDINFVIGRLNDYDMKNEKSPHWTMVRDIQVKVGESNSRFGWINTDDLNDGIVRNGVAIENDLHMSYNGYKIMGERFAKEAIKLFDNNK
jgi:hypothetical protein